MPANTAATARRNKDGSTPMLKPTDAMAIPTPANEADSRLSSQPAWFLGQDTAGNISCSHKIAEVKPRPRLVGHRFITTKRTEPLRLLFIVGGFSKIAGVAVRHTRHMIDV